MLSLRLYMAQRVSALIMIPLILGHLAVIVYAARGGLSSSDILARTRGSVGWAAYYGLFVVTVSIHAAIGLRAVLAETAGLRGRGLTLSAWLVGLILLVAGARAVIALTWP